MLKKIFGQCVCIGGMPGIGSVGKVAADYIASALECRTFQLMVSTGFPPEVPVEEGIARAIQVELKAPEGRDDLLLLCGDAQPLQPPHMYNLAGEILKALASYDVTDIVTLAAYVGTSEDAVYAVATDPVLARALEDEGFALLRNGIVGGLNGILVGLAPLYGIRGVCLMGKTDGEKAVDLSAAEGLIGATSDLLGLDVPMEILGWMREEEEPKRDDLERKPPRREEDRHAGYG
ncbi:PAC2 family protein [Candidatus Methanocrinis natronophilus]|uniref:PAC2 family protein n=1 Tax=Candidatus Methanocrinis natronophilus TaxID=3033396 RepID=A0ABT5X4T1_9EURY|nr:PAC2 family protein [Candidatus Methanocrinis natronophilus]MDF0589713.1 PAC2 family protein [Candidatus Methanocrinis natronophilus]